MKSVILARHVQAQVNKEGALGIENKNSPLTEHGCSIQIPIMRQDFIDKYGITPARYNLPVAVSDYRRPQQTARELGFRTLYHLPSIGEMKMDGTMSGSQVVAKHVLERWAPSETLERAENFIEKIKNNAHGYEIVISHGMFIAAVLLVAEQSKNFDMSGVIFDEERGFVLPQGGTASLTLST